MTRTDARESACWQLVGFNRALCHVCSLSRSVSISRCFYWINKRLLWRAERIIHYYVLVWLAALTLILVFSATTGWPRLLMAGIALYRLQDLIFSTLDNALQFPGRPAATTTYSPRTPVVLALVNIIQIVLIFAITYLTLTGLSPGSFSHPPTGRFGAFFLSWISLPPLGGGAAPLSTMAKVLTILEEATGLLIIVIAVGRFISADPSQSGPAVTVPSLIGKTKAEVNSTLAGMLLYLDALPATAPDAWTAVSQDPQPDQQTTTASRVHVTFAGNVPGLHNLTRTAAEAALSAVNLILTATPANAVPGSTAQADQIPAAGSPPPLDRTVRVSFQ